MIPARFFLRQIACVLCVAIGAIASEESDQARICSAVGQLLERGHYTRHKLDEPMSRQLLRNYLDELDYEHLFFTQQDIAGLEARYGSVIGSGVLVGDINPAVEISALFGKRISARVEATRELLKQPFDFKSDRTVEVNREHSPWPKDDADADQLWRDRIEGEVLEEKLNATEQPAETVGKRYDEMLRADDQQTREDVLATFLSVLARTFDPHSEYLTKSDLEDFDSELRLSMVGIGVVLQSEGGYPKVVDVLAGSPARRDGRLKVNDRISGVAQGSGDFVDVVGMKFNKVLELIRGRKGAAIRLQVIPPRATEPREVVELVRDNIRLKDQEARAELIEREKSRIGWITLPEFYGDPDAKPPRSAARDVASILTRLKKEAIGGLVLDLRENGGGEVEEAVKLMSLFIRRGPVLQEKDSDGRVYVSRARDSLSYDGPLVVLTDHLTASASEIFTAAMQDYRRAVIVGGESTYGKGTVQTVLELGDFIPSQRQNKNRFGALQLTIEKFYRVAGGSVQLRGVTPDVKLLSSNDLPEIGESAEKNPMAYDEIRPADFHADTDRPLPLADLRERSATRVATDAEFAYLQEDLEIERRKMRANRVSLNEETRRRELAEEKARQEARASERVKRSAPLEKVYALTLDNLRNPALQPADPQKRAELPTGSTQPTPDAARAEAVRIAQDLIDLTRVSKTASALRPPKEASRR